MPEFGLAIQFIEVHATEMYLDFKVLHLGNRCNQKKGNKVVRESRCERWQTTENDSKARTGQFGEQVVRLVIRAESKWRDRMRPAPHWEGGRVPLGPDTLVVLGKTLVLRLLRRALQAKPRWRAVA